RASPVLLTLPASCVASRHGASSAQHYEPSISAASSMSLDSSGFALQDHDDGPDFDWSLPRPERGREWIAVAVSSDDRRGSDSGEVHDSAAFTLEGGYDVLKLDPLRAGFELGVVWSRHKVEQTTGTEDDPRMNVTRWNLGARATLDVARFAVLWCDGGI